MNTGLKKGIKKNLSRPVGLR